MLARTPIDHARGEWKKENGKKKLGDKQKEIEKNKTPFDIFLVRSTWAKPGNMPLAPAAQNRPTSKVIDEPIAVKIFQL